MTIINNNNNNIPLGGKKKPYYLTLATQMSFPSFNIEVHGLFERWLKVPCMFTF